MKKNIVLFDMDGTLTEPRGKFNTELLLDLRRLSKHADIGIVTGSDIDYINQQMEKLIKYSELRYITHLLPCNGTKYFTSR
jgi:hydroxymethylpyrimidine pyrophosphatase-like HAD family hydrolase